MQKIGASTLGLVAFFILTAAPGAAFALTTVEGGNLINQTWTKAKSPYLVKGDVTVPAGSTLKIQAGVEVRFAAGDAQGSGKDAALSELTVKGKLRVNGTAASPVIFRSDDAPEKATWYGILVAPEASATIKYAVIKDAKDGITSEAPAKFHLKQSKISNMGNAGVVLRAGDSLLDGVELYDNQFGVLATGQTNSTLHNILAYHNSQSGVQIQAGPNAEMAFTIHSSTFYKNKTSGVILYCFPRSRAKVALFNSISTENEQYGFEATSTDPKEPCVFNASHSNAWGNGRANLRRVETGEGMLSANPQFVNAAKGDFRLKPSSVAIDAGTKTGAPRHDLAGTKRPLNGDGINQREYDMGAYEAAPR